MTPLVSSALLRTQSDERLLSLVKSGSDRAFEAIVHRYRKPLERFCSRGSSSGQAEDVVQQVFMKAWQALSNGTKVHTLKPWLFRIAQTTMIEAADPGFDLQELERALSPAEGADSELERRAVIRKTLTGLAALPEAQREALLRTAVNGQSRAQVAEALGVSEGAVRQLVHRARTGMRAAATALTPFQLIHWAATLGPGGSPVAEGAAASAGAAGLAKASAIVASATVLAATPTAVQQVPFGGLEKARAQPKPAVADQNRGRTKVASPRHTHVSSAAREVRRVQPAEPSGGDQEGVDRAEQPKNGAAGDNDSHRGRHSGSSSSSRDEGLSRERESRTSEVAEPSEKAAANDGDDG